MKAIKVKYLGPTDYQGARWKASIHDGGRMISQTVANNSALSFDENANGACMALQCKLGWDALMIQGTYNNDHYFVIAS